MNKYGCRPVCIAGKQSSQWSKGCNWSRAKIYDNFKNFLFETKVRAAQSFRYFEYWSFLVFRVLRNIFDAQLCLETKISLQLRIFNKVDNISVVLPNDIKVECLLLGSLQNSFAEVQPWLRKLCIKFYCRINFKMRWHIRLFIHLTYLIRLSYFNTAQR